VQLLVILRNLDPTTYGRWFRLGSSRRDALKRPMPVTLDAVSGLLHQNRNDVSRQPVVDLGWSMSVWNGAPDDEAVNFSCHFAVTSRYVRNSVVFGARVPDHTRIDVARDALHAVRDLWSPDEGNVWDYERHVLAEL
jgi:hypothetical protein